MRSPIVWFGGKGRMQSKILPYLTRWPHNIYVEPFGGGASMLFAKLPSPVEVYNDLDSGLYHFFTTLADPIAFAKFYRRVRPLLYSRELYNKCRATRNSEDDPIWRAVKWFVVARMSFSGKFGMSWGSSITISTHGMASTSSNWMAIIDLLPQIHKRISSVQIENDDWRTILKRYDTSNTLFYCDPPYVPETRRAGKYECELTAEDHKELVDVLQNIDGAAVISGYPNDIYNRLDDWLYIEFKTVCNATGKTRGTDILGRGSALAKQPRTEFLRIHPKIMKADRHSFF